MAKKLQSIRGIHDGLPADVARWRRVEHAAKAVFSRYAFDEVRLPLLVCSDAAKAQIKSAMTHAGLM